MAAHRYWRLSLFGTQGGNPLSASEVEFYAAVGGPSVAVGGTATSSSTYYSQFASLAFNGDPNDFWALDAQDGWIAYDFVTPQDIVGFGWRARSVYQNQSFRSARLEYSDNGTNWLRSFFVTPDAFSSNELKTFYPSVGDPHLTLGSSARLLPHRYWRVRGLSPTALDGYPYLGVSELEFRPEIGGVRVPFLGVDQELSNGESGGYGPKYALSPLYTDLAGFYVSGGQPNPWVGMDMRAPIVIAEVAMSPRSDQYWRQIYDETAVEFSDDLVTWSLAASRSAIPWEPYDLSPGSYQLFTFGTPSEPPVAFAPRRRAIIMS